MKPLSKSIFLVTISLFGVQIACGQSFLDRVKQKTKEKMEQRLDEKLDKELDKGLDKIENSIDSMANGNVEDETVQTRDQIMQNRMDKMMKGLGMSGEPVPVENSYSFNQLIQMQIEMYDNSEKKTSHGEFITHLNPSTANLAYEVVSTDFGDSEQGFFIIDTKNKAIVLLNDKEGKKTGIVYGMGTFMDDMKNYESEDTEDAEVPDVGLLNPNLSKTGKTKTIAGFKCQQYLYNDDDTESEFWITDELETDTRDFFSTLFKTSVYTNGMGYGYVMESASKDKTTGNRSSMKVTKVDRHSNASFNLSSYEITNLGTFKMPSGVEE